MLRRLKSTYLLLGLSLLLWVAAFHVSPSLAQDDSWDDDFKQADTPGGRAFSSTCAGCHGLDGRGSDKGVNIAGSPKVRHFTDAQVSDIISNGVPGTGMPAFHNLNARQISSLVSYLRVLQGKLDARISPGNPVRGKGVFFGKGECSNCHTIAGKGGFLGPDLSAYGSAVSAKKIRDEILRTERIPPAGYRSAVLTTRDGDRLEGVIRNEDNFSLQFQAKDGSFHFFQKSDLQAVEPLGQSMMPSDYRQRLSPGELNDLVSYLLNASPAATPSQISHKPEEPTQ
jgi:putative heme-binding domain-containing protein